MSVLAGLKLVAAKPQLVMDPVQLRRNKRVSKLDEQIALAKAAEAGKQYAPTRTKRVKDATGMCRWFRCPNVFELGFGRWTAATLGKLREATAVGELDAQVEAVSAEVRKGFKR
jgi:hypothetical protein